MAVLGDQAHDTAVALNAEAMPSYLSSWNQSGVGHRVGGGGQAELERFRHDVRNEALRPIRCIVGAGRVGAVAGRARHSRTAAGASALAERRPIRVVLADPAYVVAT